MKTPARSLRTLLLVLAAAAIAEPALAQDDPAADPAAPAPKPRRPRVLQRRPRRPRPPATPAPEEQPPAEVAPAAGTPPGAPPAAPSSPSDKEPPGAAGPLPSNMDKIAQAADVPYHAKPGGHMVKFNLNDADLAELVNHISGLTGRRFIYGAKVRQIKATVVSPEPVTLDEAYQAFLSILEANGMTVVPHGRFYKIIDSGGVVTQPTPIVARGEPVPDADRYITRLYRLENATPDDVAAVLNKFKSKDGDITPYAPGRLLIITDTATQVRRLIRIIEEIDIGGSGQHMWIEPVHHGTAADMAKRLNELFEIGAPGAAAAAGAPGTAKQPSGISRVVADDQSQSLIVVGTEDSYLKLLELLKRLDTQGTDAGHIHVLPLQYAIADELSQTLTQMLAGQANKQAGATGVGTAGGMFEGDVRVTPDKSTNSLIVTSSGRDFATFRLVIDKLDRPRRQVFIEAVIMDMGVSDTMDMGVSFHGGHSFGGGANDPFLLSGFNAGKSLAFPQDPSLLQGFAAGVRGSELPGTQDLLGPGISIPAFGVVLNALASGGRTNILATPHIIATDNVVAEISIGENIPLQTNAGGTSVGSLAGLAGGSAATAGIAPLLGLGGGFGFNAPRQDVGNKIKVTPHINESNQVRLEIDQESSAPGAPVGTLGAVPITKRTANTTVVVADQQTVVIGGLMRDEYTVSREKVPILGDLPVLGALFRHSNTVKRKTNLLLILTPHVIREQADLRRIFERKMEERQEFIDRYFVFSDVDWKPPKDWSRTNGLVENIRQAYLKNEVQEEVERESKSYEDTGERAPSEPIELPTSVREGNSAELVAKPKAAAPSKAAPARPAPARTPARQRAGGRRGELDSPIIVNPIARSVNVERVE